jgi:hypothetical protein
MEQVRTTWTAADGTLVTLRPIEARDFTLESRFALIWRDADRATVRTNNGRASGISPVGQR